MIAIVTIVGRQSLFSQKPNTLLGTWVLSLAMVMFCYQHYNNITDVTWNVDRFWQRLAEVLNHSINLWRNHRSCPKAKSRAKIWDSNQGKTVPRHALKYSSSVASTTKKLCMKMIERRIYKLICLQIGQGELEVDWIHIANAFCDCRLR